MSSLLKRETKQALLEFFEKEIDGAAQKIVRLKDRQDHFAYGQLQVFMTFRRLLSDTVTDELIEPLPQRHDVDRGFLSALEKTLVQLQFLEPKSLTSRFETQLTAEQKRTSASPHLQVDLTQHSKNGVSSTSVNLDAERAQQTADLASKQPKAQPVSNDLKAFLEKQINSAAQKIADRKDLDFDHFANGQLGYLLALRRWIEGTSTGEDLGLHEAINDVLLAAKIRDERQSYLSGLLP